MKKITDKKMKDEKMKKMFSNFNSQKCRKYSLHKNRLLNRIRSNIILTIVSLLIGNLLFLVFSNGVLALSEFNNPEQNGFSDTNSKLVSIDTLTNGIEGNIETSAQNELVSNFLRVSLSSTKYKVGDLALVRINAIDDSEMDMVIGNDYGQTLYHYDGKTYPISYRFPVRQNSGKYYVTVTVYVNGTPYTQSEYFNVESLSGDLNNLLEDAKEIHASDVKSNIMQSNDVTLVEVKDTKTGEQTDNLTNKQTLELVIRTTTKPNYGKNFQTVKGEIKKPLPVELNIKKIIGADWENSNKIEISGIESEVVSILEEKGLDVQGGVSVTGLDNVIVNDYYAIVDINTSGVNYNTIYYCNDFNICSLVNRCVSKKEEIRAKELCYFKDLNENLVKVYVPHFSSIILTLDNSSTNITFYSPDNSTTINSGQGIYLNFSIDEEIYANYSLDGIWQNIENRLVINNTNFSTTYFSSLLVGSLREGVTQNGAHNISIAIFNLNNSLSYVDYNFIINDAQAPIIELNPDLDGTRYNYTINISNNSINFSYVPLIVNLSSDENLNLRYRLNNFTPTNLIYLSFAELRLNNYALNLSVQNGSNVLEINVSDLQNNSENYIFNFDINIMNNYFNATNVTPPNYGNCSDLVQNFHDELNETGIDCGGSCSSCIEFNITTDKLIYNQTEQVEITVNSRSNSNVTIVVNGGSSSYSATSKFFPTYYIFTDTLNIGTYSISGIMRYRNLTENKTVTFNVISNQPQNPLELSISSNGSTINEGEIVAFAALVSGNSSKVSFKWDLNGDGTIDSTLEKINYTYLNNGTYLVNLSINSSGWNLTSFKTITVQKLFNLTIHVIENITGTPLESVSVNVGNYNSLTDSNGIAKFTIRKDDYNLVISKLGYYSYYMPLELYSSNSIEIVLGKVDSEAPIIELISPINNSQITEKSTTIGFKVNDASSVNCSIYTNSGGNWWTLETTIVNAQKNSLSNVELTNLEDNKTYSWRVNCKDEKGNTNFSDSWYFITNSSSVSNSLYVNLDAQDADAQEFSSTIDELIKNIDNYDKPEKELADIIKFKRMLELSKAEVVRYNRDLHDLKWRRLNQTELDAETDRLLNAIEKAKQDSPKNLKVLENSEFVKYPTKVDIEDIVIAEKGLQDDKKIRSKMSSLTDQIILLQTGITITTRASVYEIEYQSGVQKKSTAIIKEIKSSKKSEGLLYYEYIPKEIAPNASEINFLYDHDVVVEDPIVKSLFTEDKQYVYIINKNIDLKTLEKSKSVMMPMVIEFTDQGTNFITGFAFVDMFKSDIFKIDNTRLMIEIIVIIVLLVIYLVYTVEDVKTMPLIGSMFGSKASAKIELLVNNMAENIEKNNYQSAKKGYAEISIVYKDLKKNEKKEYYLKLEDIHNRLDVLYINNLIKNAMQKLKESKVSEAIEDYTSICEIYKKISTKYKAQVLLKCNELNQKITEIQNEDE